MRLLKWLFCPVMTLVFDENDAMGVESKANRVNAWIVLRIKSPMIVSV